MADPEESVDLTEEELAELELEEVPEAIPNAAKKLEDYAKQEQEQLADQVKKIQRLNDATYVSGKYTDVKHQIEEELGKLHQERSANGTKEYEITYTHPVSKEEQTFLIYPNGLIYEYVITPDADGGAGDPDYVPVEGYNVLNLDLNKERGKEAHPASAALMRSSLELEATKNGYTAAMLAEYEDYQYRFLQGKIQDRVLREQILKEIHDLDPDAEKTKDQHFTPQKFIVGKLRNAGVEGTESDLLYLATILWANETNRDDAVVNPHYGSLIYNEALYPDFHKRASMTAVLDYVTTGETTHPLDELAPEGELPDDRMFLPGFYKMLEDKGRIPDTVDARIFLTEIEINKYAKMGYDRAVMSREEVQEIMRLKFEDHVLRDVGVELCDVTRALFEGDLSIDKADMGIIHESFGRPDTYTNEYTATGDDAIHRNHMWNNRYGSMVDMGTVRTYVGNEIKTLTPEEVAFRSFMRWKPGVYGERFKEIVEDYKNGNTDMTLGEARALLANNPEALADMEHEIQNTLESHSAVTFFSQQGHEGYNFAADYQRLRLRGSYMDNLRNQQTLDKDGNVLSSAQTKREEFERNGQDIETMAAENTANATYDAAYKQAMTSHGS